jgi:molybdopterin-guanine dinucleotide biosynthesis protein A
MVTYFEESQTKSPQAPVPNSTGGLVLCGGKSSRMGRSKAMLPFGPELMLQRVVRLLSALVEPIVVVAVAGQELPPLPEGVILARDKHEGRGPLEGLYAGLCAMRGRANAVYATSCDVPLLVPDFVRRMIELLGSHEIAVPVEGSHPLAPRDDHKNSQSEISSFHHPLAAVYRVSVHDRIATLLAADRLRPVFLFDECDTIRVPVEDLRQVDPDLATLMNLNRPEEYKLALARAGFD